MKSIERHLVARVLGALGIGALVLGFVTFIVTLEEMNEVFDENLKQVALSVASYQRASALRDTPTPFQLRADDDDPDDTEIVTLTWSPQAQRTFISNPSAEVPYAAETGLASITHHGVAWQVYTVVQPEGAVQAAQRVDSRHLMARESAWAMFVPLVGLIALVGLLLVFALRRGLRPLDDATADVAARSAASLAPIDSAGMPREIHPLVRAINGLMQRLSVAFDTQRRFLADAAHELRTPVTALKLQLQLMARAGSAAERDAAMHELEAGVERSQRLIEQLLQLSRAEPDVEIGRIEPVALDELVRTVVAQLSVKADHKGIDLGADASQPIELQADRHQLGVLLTNLVENALRYTQPGGVVDVVASVVEHKPVLRVIDSGPGIPEPERRRVFDRFYRGEVMETDTHGGIGSGLGLSIVKAIAERHAAVVALLTAPSGRGLEVRVTFG